MILCDTACKVIFCSIKLRYLFKLHLHERLNLDMLYYYIIFFYVCGKFKRHILRTILTS